MPPAAKSLVVCADDFGIHASVSNAIVQLVQSRRISATSVLVFGGDCERAAPRLQQCRTAEVSVGLHFSMTDSARRRHFIPLPLLLASASLRLLNPATIRRMVREQLDRFEQLFGCRPDFLDGHEHVHQLPAIRPIVLDVVCERYGSKVAIRSTRAVVARGPKARLIAKLGGTALARAASERGLTVNADFAGAYSFERAGHYRTRARGWLASIADGGLIMCHPGADPQADSISMARYEEYSYLRSAEWPQDLAAQGVHLVPFRGVTR